MRNMFLLCYILNTAGDAQSDPTNASSWKWLWYRLGQAGSLVSCFTNFRPFCTVGWSHQKGQWRQTHILSSFLPSQERARAKCMESLLLAQLFCQVGLFLCVCVCVCVWERERERDLDQLITINMSLGQSMFHSEDL